MRYKASSSGNGTRMIVPELSGNETWWVYRGDNPSPPVDWSIRVGEFAYNLRSSLDHLVWQLVESNGATPGTWTYFPVRKNVEDEPESVMTGRCKASGAQTRSISAQFSRICVIILGSAIVWLTSTLLVT